MNITLTQEEIREAVAFYLKEKKLNCNYSHEITNIEMYDNGCIMGCAEIKADVSSTEHPPMAPQVPKQAY